MQKTTENKLTIVNIFLIRSFLLERYAIFYTQKKKKRIIRMKNIFIQILVSS